MNDQFDAILRERINRLTAAVPAEPAPLLVRGGALPGRHPVRRRLALTLSLGLVFLAALAVSLPTLSRLAFEAQARELGVPDGVEIVASGGGATELMFVIYRDAGGRGHCVGDCQGMELLDRDGKVVYQGPPAPTATPNPRR